MKPVLTIIGILALAGTAFAISEVNVSGTWRYKLTVEVNTPEGVKSGYAIREISNSASSVGIDLPDVGNPADERGEAVVVDLGERGKLFALISDRSEHELYRAFPVDGATTVSGIKHYNSLKPGMKASLDNKNYWPITVTFNNLDDPLSVQGVDKQNLRKTFGTGVDFKGITVEITDEDITQEIEKVLPWLKDIKGGYLHGGSTSRGSPMGLYGGNFRRGEKR